MTWAVSKNPGGTYAGEDDPRWAYVIAALDGSPYLSRLLLPRVRIPRLGIDVRPMLHHFHQPDDKEMHSHPWSYAFSLILSGEYEEERLVGDPDWDRYMTADGQCALCHMWRGECRGHEAETDLRRVRFFNFLTKQDYHRVTKLRGDVFTLFISGTPEDDWGFLDEHGKHVPWQKWFEMRAAQSASEP